MTRRGEVEALLRAGKFGVSTRNDLAEKHDVHYTVIEADRRWVIDRWRENLPVVQPQEVEADFLERIRQSEVNAGDDGDHRSKAAFFNIEMRVLGLDRRTLTVETARAVINDPTTPEGRAALVADLRAIPRDVLLEAAATPADIPAPVPALVPQERE